jgi:hypothetical protein
MERRIEWDVLFFYMSLKTTKERKRESASDSLILLNTLGGETKIE